MSWMIPGDIPESGDGYECEESKKRRTLLTVKLIVVIGAVALTTVILDWVGLLPHI